ncbi:MAG TPA: hypothetical protein VFW33_08615 [Gemmataceae bacterium]|nr:hypothetical protein [Gemmataceae bacterium]
MTGRFVGPTTRQDVLDGAAVLSIISGDDTDRDETAYWCLALFTGDVCTGFRLTKFASGEVYDLPRSLDGCDCPDRTYKPERPGGCKHMAALRQALPTVQGAKPAPARKPDRKTERDDITGPGPAAA